MKHTFEILFEKLQNNFEAVESIERRIINTEESYYYNLFNLKKEQQQEINNLLDLKKRVLKMRFTLLENIHLATTKEMQHVSTTQKNMNLQKSAA